jgi:hypothetical protein
MMIPTVIGTAETDEDINQFLLLPIYKRSTRNYKKLNLSPSQLTSGTMGPRKSARLSLQEPSEQFEQEAEVVTTNTDHIDASDSELVPAMELPRLNDELTIPPTERVNDYPAAIEGPSTTVSTISGATASMQDIGLLLERSYVGRHLP